MSRLRLITLLVPVVLLSLFVAACASEEAPAPAPTPDFSALIQGALSNQPTGATPDEVASAVQAALAAQPGVTEAQVADTIAKALSDRPGITEAQVADAIANALAAQPGVTEGQVAGAIAQALTRQTPGLTEAEVAAAIGRALEGRPGISQEDIQNAVEMAVADAMTPDPFRIGAMDSLTGVGESYGNPIVNAKQLAVDEINAAGGINGRVLELIIEDSKCNAQDAITAYKKLTDVDGVKIILGTTCSGAMLGSAPLAEADGVVLFSPSATNPDIANAGDYIFRTAISDAQLGVDTGNAMWVDGVRSLATITETTDYAEGVRRTTVEQFEKLGGEIVGEERYASDSTDFRSQLTKLIGANPDALHLAIPGGVAGWNDHQAGERARIYRPDLHRERSHRRYCARDSRRPRNWC